MICAFFLALLEIQIEGENGWAKNLPTFKVNNPLRKIVNVPNFTGYHLYLFLTLFSFLHFPYVWGKPFTLSNELLVVQSFFLIVFIEDFLWFVFNPKWGLKRFLTEDIPWHPGKFLGLPKNYFYAAAFMVLLLSINFFI